MPQEIEAKFKVDSLEPVRRALRKAGGEYLGTFLQTDYFFDTPDRALRGGDCGLRIRRTRYLRSAHVRKDTRPLLTYKGPRGSNSNVKMRKEVQTHVDDGASAAEILRACGMDVVRTIQKRRASYRLGRCLVELDELPRIGCFVEIEAGGEELIEWARRKLHLKGDAITAPYIDLLEGHCLKFGKGCETATFDACADCD